MAEWATPELEALARHLHVRVLQEVDLEQLAAQPRPQQRATLEALLNRLIQNERVILGRAQRDLLLERILNEATGYGPLEALLCDPTITEIMVNGTREVYVERGGTLQRVAVTFKDQAHLRHILDRIVSPLGRRIDESSPMVDARLPDGSRVNAVIPPVALDGALLTIRRFPPRPLSLQDLVDRGSITPAMAAFLGNAVRAKVNVLISGGTGSGKTTLLAALADLIPDGERVITVEDMAELQLTRPHVARLESRPANVEGVGEITIRQLVRNALRMRPDRIIVGEVRGGEAFDMLQAMNTGHAGSLTTIHANSAREALSRLEAMVLMAGTTLTVDIIREHLLSAVHLLVQTQRLPDGARRVVEVARVQTNAGRPQVVPVSLGEVPGS